MSLDGQQQLLNNTFLNTSLITRNFNVQVFKMYTITTSIVSDDRCSFIVNVFVFLIIWLYLL